ncbi:hypothetical protein P8452_20204 [Trifolium repens]|nr:hypothetical protein P8452_20204 [Trifolium repens]
MTAKDDSHRQIETDNSLREVSRNDAIASKKEKSLKRRKSRLYTFTEIIDRKNDAENLPQTQVVVPLPPPPSSPPTFPAIVPPIPRPLNTQTEDLMNVIVLDDQEEEASQRIMQFRRRPIGLRSDQYPLKEIFTVSAINVAPLKGNAAKLKLENPEINGSKKLKDTPENKMVNLAEYFLRFIL